MPRRPRGGDRRLEDRPTANSARCWSASIAAIIWSMSAWSAPASASDTVRRIMPALKAAASDKSPFGGTDAPRKTARRALAEAGAGRRDRVRRLDRRRQGAAGRVQGPAGGQAGGRGRGRNAGRDRGRRAARRRSARSRARRGRDASAASPPGDGRGDLEARQGAVAGRRRRRAGHQARSRALLRGGRRLDDPPHQGPAVLDHPRARRHRRRAVLPAPRHAGHLEPARAGQGLRRPQALSADRPDRGAGRGGADRRRSNCIPGIARPMQPDMPGRLVFDLDPAPDVDVCAR